jgi:hypothetical protein
MTEEEQQAAAYIKLQDDVEELVKKVVIRMFQSWDPDLRMGVENMTFGSALFEQRVKQVAQSQWNKN